MYPSKIMLFFLILERHVPIYYLTTVSLVRICFTFNEIETGQTDREREYSALIGRLELTNQSGRHPRALGSILLNEKQTRTKASEHTYYIASISVRKLAHGGPSFQFVDCTSKSL